MRIMVLVIAALLVSPGWVAAFEPVGQTAPAYEMEAHPYTGIIKNETRYEVSIPSENSEATLIIPPHSWIQYTIWGQRAKVTAYQRGRPFYCLNIFAHPQEYPFMCQKYDFITEIRLPEPVHRYHPIPRRGPVRHNPCDDGVEAFG